MFFFGLFRLQLAAPLLLLWLFCAQQCHAAYFIQDDCTDLQRQFIEQAMSNAGTLARLGISYTTQGQSADGDQLYQWMFASKPRTVVRMSLQGVADNTEPGSGEAQGGASADVLLHCSSKRLRTGKLARIFDTKLREFISNKWDCTTGAHAFTAVPKDKTKPDIIQFCPWFLDYGMNQKAQFQGQFKSSLFASMIDRYKLDERVTKRKYTPIDLFQLFDKVVVHELTHTRRGGSKDDVPPDPYGWKNCRKLSAVADVSKSSVQNADCLALFASISGIISRRAGMVREDGTIDHGDTQQGKRDLWLEGTIPRTVKRQTERFDAVKLKGRPVFKI